MHKNCLECNKKINGRIDRKFCSDSCRNIFNNKNNRINSRYIRTVNTILTRNRKILEELIIAENKRVSKMQLEQRGFNFYYFTHTYYSKIPGHSFFCYEYGYHPVENDAYILLTQAEEE